MTSRITSNVLTDKNANIRAEIDKEIKQLQDRIHTLRNERNALLPIGLLPPDVLIRIFALTIKQRHHGKSVLRLSWVSHYWRRVVLGCKGFWTLIDNSKLGWVAACLERTHGALLSVSLEISQFVVKKSRPALETLFKVSPQFKRIHIARPTVLRPVPLDFWKSPAPFLDTLYIEDFTIENDILTLPSEDLRFLSLERCKFDWEFALRRFSKLTSLSILKPTERLPATEFMDNLRFLPHLERLSLECALQGAPAEGSIHWKTKHELISLSLVDESSFFIPSLYFLERALQQSRLGHDFFFASCTFGVEHLSSGDVLGRILIAFEEVMSRTSGNLATAFKILESLDGFTKWSLDYGTPEILESNSRPIPMRLIIESQQTAFLLFLGEFCRNISLLQLHTLHISQKRLRSLDIAQLPILFGSLDRLHHIRIQTLTENMAEVIQTLAYRKPDDQDPTLPTPSSTSFTSLRTFGLIDPINRSLCENLARILAVRKANELGLQSLILGTYSQQAHDEVISLFKEAVRDVVVENFGTFESTKKIFSSGNIFEDVTLAELRIDEDFKG
ncbi:hypothetical protein BDN72DRAFT_898636 [Pluteus cervinus]|uniref:Uncharacterized protein n=1 Tax=Pluteus cervinus TaxID=181527 RepID=A0ACD3ARD9_9AGAR|nr:hypothetical protein BDN72DRAFT_898636 [Pluteus cervinus]